MRTWLWTGVSAVLLPALAIFINYATDLNEKWSWGGVIVCCLVVAVVEHVRQPVSPDKADVRTVHDVTDANLRSMADHSGLPARGDRRPSVNRAELDELVRAQGSFVITGEPGCGKSGALHRIAEHLREQGEDVVLLTAETLGDAPGAIRGDVTLSRSVFAVLTAWRGNGRATLLIDGLDSSRRGSLTWLSNLVTDLNGSRWRTIATMRRFDLRHAGTWRRAFAGIPISAHRARRDHELHDVRHIVLGDFSAGELQRLAAEDSAVRAIVEHAGEDFLRLIRNPFNLRLACELLPAAQPVTARDRLELLQRYWRKRVLDQQDGEERGRVLAAVSREMVARRTLRAPASVVPESLLAAQRAVLRDGVLKETPGQLVVGGTGMLVFSHHVLFDYAVAAILLSEGSQSRLREALHEDPNLVLVARPSVDLHLAAVWHSDHSRQPFAKVMIGLADAGHSIAGIAAASVLVCEARRDEELRWIVELPGGSGFSSMVGWIAGVISSAEDRVRERVRMSAGRWADLLAVMGDRLTDDFDHELAGQALRLMKELADLGPVASGAEARANFLTRLMTSALEQPVEREWYGQQVARYLPGALPVCSEVAVVLRRTLAPEIMGAWLTRYLESYLDNIALIAEADAQLAEEVLLSTWGLHDNSEDVTPLLQGVLPMTSTRRQDVEHLKWLIGQKFPEYLAVVGLKRAVAALAAVTTAEAPYLLTSASSYPVEVASAVGRVDVVMVPLRHSVSRGAPAVLRSFAETLRTAEMSGVDAKLFVAAVVASVGHPEAWSAVLHAVAENVEVLGCAFVPALMAGGLFVHSGTREAACVLVRSAAPHLSQADRHALEAAIQKLPVEVAQQVAELIADVEPPVAVAADIHEADEPSPEPAADLLRQAIETASVDGADPGAVDALEAELWHTVDDGPQDHLVRAADVLIAHRRPEPDTPLGELVVRLCLEATDSESPEDGVVEHQ